ncbi:hypothetical protein Y032_0045g1253 [Ancylostoma ceylanicum]|uniref:Uncharacterized protein n=1 Tax=Ancylostoma ceylanicum TaxID=53326 RepID=A0A016UE12_9BILA|nr:hypothetical protein Y032_0045g1253 [Ancylostoma ceylanicum]
MMDVDEPTDEEELAERLDALTFGHLKGAGRRSAQRPARMAHIRSGNYYARDNDGDEDMRYVLYNTDSIAGGNREDPTQLPLVDPEAYCVLCRTDKHLIHHCIAPIPFRYRYEVIALIYRMCGRWARSHPWQEGTA